jgi:RNA polymerase sigma-70 factor (ECF subfamily)
MGTNAPPHVDSEELSHSGELKWASLASSACPTGQSLSAGPSIQSEEDGPSSGGAECRQGAELSESMVPDEQLIIAVAQGDQQAFEVIYERYASAVFGLILKTFYQLEAAEEGVQEVFSRMWQRAGSFDTSRSFAPWLFSMTRNYCIDELRRQRVRPQSVYQDERQSVVSTIPDSIDIGEIVLRSEQRRIVRDALQQLPVEQRQALELMYFAGLTQEEIAARLGYPLGTIKTRKRLGLQKIRHNLRGTLSN